MTAFAFVYAQQFVDVYADVLFLVNAGMDCLCLALTARLLHRPLSFWRLLCGGAMGGLYAVVTLFLPSGLWVLIPDAAVCLAMCAVVFGRRRLPLSGAVFFVLSMALGGVMTGLYSFINRALYNTGVLDLPPDDEGPEGWLLWLLAAAGGLISLAGSKFFKKSAARRNCRVIIRFGEQTLELDGMVDTGNLLTDPLSGRPVICVDEAYLRPRLPAAIAKDLPVFSDGVPDASRLSAASVSGRIRLIPTTTATGHTLLIGLLPDRLSLRVDTGKLVHGGTKHLESEVDAILALTMNIQEAEALVPATLLP